MYKSILVPLDGSKLAECSLQHVKAIARGCQVPKVTLLAVIEEVLPAFTEDAGQSQVEAMVREKEAKQVKAMDNANQYLARASAQLGRDQVEAKVDVVQAPRGEGVADVILGYASNIDTDLIIMSTHGRSGITRWAMGSVADRVIRHSPVPVLIVASPGCRI